MRALLTPAFTERIERTIEALRYAARCCNGQCDRAREALALIAEWEAET